MSQPGDIQTISSTIAGGIAGCQRPISTALTTPTNLPFESKTPEPEAPGHAYECIIINPFSILPILPSTVNRS